MADISIISSLYKTEKFLPHFLQAVRQVAQAAYNQGVLLEFVIVANQASLMERTLLEHLAYDLNRRKIAQVQLLFVPRENLHASWNRGIRAATSPALGFWNVDDSRTVKGLLEGYLMIVGQGYDLVDFPVEYKISRRRLGFNTVETRIDPPQYRPILDPIYNTGAFFMFSKSLYERAGAFDEGYPIVGDFDWCMRETVRTSRIGYGSQIAGQFFLHGGNITQASGMSDWIAYNVALLRLGEFKKIQPVEPSVMKQAWESWGKQDTDIPQEIKDWLWGEGALERYQRYQWERRLAPPLRHVFLLLAKYGLVKSVDWDIHHAR